MLLRPTIQDKKSVNNIACCKDSYTVVSLSSVSCFTRGFIYISLDRNRGCGSWGLGRGGEEMVVKRRVWIWGGGCGRQLWV